MSLMSILSKREEALFNKPPKFDIRQQKHFFTLAQSIIDTAFKLSGHFSDMIFILQFGYFKATHRFFDYSSFHQSDIEFVSNKYKLDRPDLKFTPHERTMRRYRQLIKEYFDIK